MNRPNSYRESLGDARLMWSFEREGFIERGIAKDVLRDYRTLRRLGWAPEDAIRTAIEDWF